MPDAVQAGPALTTGEIRPPRGGARSHVAQPEDMAMNSFDFSPLFRSTIGFDRLMQLAESATRLDASYPPYNIEVTGESSYRLTMAVAGFSPDELDVTVKENTLEVSGHAKTEKEPQQTLYRGIARRAFERRFQLADHIKVTGA